MPDVIVFPQCWFPNVVLSVLGTPHFGAAYVAIHLRLLPQLKKEALSELPGPK
jgi:hypothetical protein